MHLAAACQCPTVAIFGPSVESAWHPWKVVHRLVMAPEAIIPTADPDYFPKKEKLNVSTVALDDVWNACREMLDQKGEWGRGGETHGTAETQSPKPTPLNGKNG